MPPSMGKDPDWPRIDTYYSTVSAGPGRYGRC